MSSSPMPPCDWDHSFPVNVWKLRCCSLPWCLALTSLYFLSAPKNEYCSCLPHLHCGGSPSAAFTSWAPGIAIPFPLSPLPAPDLQTWVMGGIPIPHPLLYHQRKKSYLLQKTYPAADKSLELFLPPLSQSHEFAISEMYPERKSGQAARWLL